MITASQVTQWESEVEAWKETARQHAANEEYYRNLLISIGTMLGPEAFTSDDGTVQQDVLCAKIPELVKKLITQ